MEKYINVSKNMKYSLIKKKKSKICSLLMPQVMGVGNGDGILDTNIQMLNKVKSENCNVFFY